MARPWKGLARVYLGGPEGRKGSEGTGECDTILFQLKIYAF